MNPCPALFPTAYFPSIALMAAMIRHKEIVIEQQETFPKQTHRNRTVIVTANGPMTLTVPALRPNGNLTLTSDIGISYTEKWNLIHWRAIESAYNASPFFLYYHDDIERVIMGRYEHLLQLNERILKLLFKKLKVDIAIQYSTDFARPGTVEDDYRDRFSYKHPETLPTCQPYVQVFDDRMPFNANVSVIDTLFNLGPDTKDYLLGIKL